MENSFCCNGKIENVKVYVRIRPLLETEIKESVNKTIRADEDNTIILNNTRENEFSKMFKFHKIFQESTSQIEVYSTAALPIVETVLNGFNGTIFVYGQTGTGKTFTMVGSSNDLKGIIPNSFTHIFEQISLSSDMKSFVVTATYLEIYNENIRDLLSDNIDKKLVIHEHKLYGTYVKDLSGFIVNSVNDAMKLFVRGNKNRTTKSNLLNDTSSRSHAIFTVTVESKDKKCDTVTVGKLNLVDLAGSERLNRTKVTGDRLREAGHINLSLSVLGNVISSLVDGKSTYVPYRNSKLTRLLQDSLGGNSKTAMIATISPAEIDYGETICTLRYASRVKNIENFVSVNRKEKGLIESFEEQIEQLKQQVEKIQQQQLLKKHKQYNMYMKANEKRKIEEELSNTEKIKQDLLSKMDSIQNKIIVGGVNLLDKVEEQSVLIKFTSDKLEELHKSSQELTEALYRKSEENVFLKQNYSTLQEENSDLDRKILQVQLQLKEAYDHQRRNECCYQFERERSSYDFNALSKKNSKYSLIIDSYIPHFYVEEIERNIRWREQTQDFTVNQIAYGGNHIRKIRTGQKKTTPVHRQIRTSYLEYGQK